MRQYLWLLSKKHWDYFILFLLAIIFLVVYLFLYLRPTVLDLSPLSVLSCGNSRLFGSWVERGTVSTIADVDIECGGIDPLEFKEQKVPAYLVLNQPDESINYFFIRQLVFYNQFSAAEDLNAGALNQVHPRSTTVVNGRLVPIGFPGFIVLWAVLIKILTFFFSKNFFNVFAVILTPLVGVATPFLAYYLWRFFWSKPVALAAAMLLFILPPWWYNASRPFQHNLLFLFLLLAAVCFYLSVFNPSAKKRLAKIFFSGLFWALALYVRPSEAVWMLGLLVYGLIWSRKDWGRRGLISFIVGLLVVAILFFVTQYVFYGSIFGSGYVKPLGNGAAGSVFQGPQGINFWQAIVLPFGFHPVTVAKTFLNYFFILFRPWSLLILAGICLLSLNRLKIKSVEEETGKFNLRYFLVWLVLSVFILIFYGSWNFYDNLVGVSSVGTSYVRYFLPIYVLSLPLGAYFLVKLWQLPKVTAKILVGALCFFLLASGAAEVYYKLDGLRQVKDNVKQYQEWQEKIYQLTELDAIVVTRYADKYIFPGRKVIAGWSDPDQIKAIGQLVNSGRDVYFYDLRLFGAEKDDLSSKLNEVGVAWGKIMASWDNLELIKLTPSHP